MHVVFECLQIAQEKARADAEQKQQEQAVKFVGHRFKMHAVKNRFVDSFWQIMLAAEAKLREQALDPSVEIFTGEKKAHVAVLGFKVEKEQVRLALEAQALPIASFVNINMSPRAVKDTKGFVWIWKCKGESTTCCRSPET